MSRENPNNFDVLYDPLGLFLENQRRDSYQIRNTQIRTNKKDKMLIKGDCLVAMKKLIDDGVVVDMVLVDPPYGITACEWDTPIPFDLMWQCLNKIVKKNGAICIFGSEPFSSRLRLSNIDNFKYDWIWNKITGSNIFNLKHQPFRTHEAICVFCQKAIEVFNPQRVWRTESSLKKNPIGRENIIKSGKGAKELHNYGFVGNPKNHILSSDGKKHPGSIIKFSKIKTENRYNSHKHPTMKPVPLLEYLIKSYTNRGDTVLDFTMGSGSTGVAAAKQGREFIGIENNDKYFAMAEKRILAEKSQLKMEVF